MGEIGYSEIPYGSGYYDENANFDAYERDLSVIEIDYSELSFDTQWYDNIGYAFQTNWFSEDKVRNQMNDVSISLFEKNDQSYPSGILVVEADNEGDKRPTYVSEPIRIDGSGETIDVTNIPVGEQYHYRVTIYDYIGRDEYKSGNFGFTH